MKQNQLAIKMWIFFGYNYHYPKDFIKYICEKTNRLHLVDHLTEKFDYIWQRYGSHAVMNFFYSELDEDLREALVEYALKVYAPQGMHLSDDEMKLLGI